MLGSVVLTAEVFERLLAALSSDREAAGEKYELIRFRLVKYFEWRHCHTPEELADDTLDRVSRRLAEGEQIRAGEIMVYIYGVARNVLSEYNRSRQRDQRAATNPLLIGGESPAEEEHRRAQLQLDCLARCLERLPAETRQVLLRYHQPGGQKIADRQDLARELGIPINALRIRVHRIKSDLQRCILKCMGEQK